MPNHSLRRRLEILACGLALLALTPAAPAASFSVSPIRVELDQSHRTGVVTLRNEGDATVVVQIATVAWTVDEAGDHYEETHEILATPPVFEVPAKGQQIVRVALRRDVDATTEIPYRVYFEEVPQARTASFNGLNVSLRVGVPVFVAPLAKTAATLEWQAAWTAEGTLVVSATNHGTAHVQVTDFDLTASGRAPIHVGGSKYVLPGTQARWTVTPDEGTAHPGYWHLTGHSDQGDLTTDLPTTAP